LVNEYVNGVDYIEEDENVNDLIDVLNDDDQVLDTIDSILDEDNEAAEELASEVIELIDEALVLEDTNSSSD
jgi:hypothetical protein